MPKRAVRVEVALVDRAPAPVELFVADDEAVPRLLEGELEFLPAHEVEGGAWMVLRRSLVVWLRLPPEAEDLELYDHEQDVRIELAGGSSLDGSLLYSAPPERARVVDHLNGPARFLELWQGEQRCLVNKAYIVRLKER